MLPFPHEAAHQRTALADMSFLGALLITCALAAGGIYVLTHVQQLADALQRIYVRAATQKRNRNDWDSSLYIYDPEYWRRPLVHFLFKGGVIFAGLWLSGLCLLTKRFRTRLNQVMLKLDNKGSSHEEVGLSLPD
jgi:hypothetical protein